MAAAATNAAGAPEGAELEPTRVAVVGAGAAGLWTAIVSAREGAEVALVSRTPLTESASFRAQGGLAAALGPDDSPRLHAEDTERSGRRLCRPAAVELLAREAPGAVRELEALGVPFDRADGDLALGLEGGHARRRIVHAEGAATGQHLTSRLAELAASEPRLRVLESCSALALWSDGSRCAGVLTDAGPLRAAATVIATGGAAALWRRNTNPWGAIGAGPVLAHAAGARLADLELCQFHPTGLALPDSDRDGLLVTEAVRGEGAVLLDAAGKRFTDELAPRDAVTAAILDRMEADDAAHVLLDLRAVPAKRFPTVFTSLREAGLDPEGDPVPVSPAAHYSIGGIATDLDGRSSLPGMYAVGECATNGLHGANRLASNSLSECFVFGSRAARAAAAEPAAAAPPPPGWRFEPPTETTREAVWRGAGPRRSEASLRRLLDDPYPLAAMIARSALARRETRGVHARSDHPDSDPAMERTHTVCAADGEVTLERWE